MEGETKTLETYSARNVDGGYNAVKAIASSESS